MGWFDVDIFKRSVRNIDHPEAQQGVTPNHRVRPLLPAAMRGDHPATDPFLSSMEDWFPRGVEGQTVHSLQLWVSLPASQKMSAQRHQDLAGSAMPVRREPGVEARVFSGASDGVAASTKNYVPVTMVEFRLEPGAFVRQDLPEDYNTFVVVLEGSGTTGEEGTKVGAGDVAWLPRGQGAEPSDTRLQAGDEAMPALLYAGRPLREPVVAGGPFVMNSKEQIAQAYADYRTGLFRPA